MKKIFLTVTAIFATVLSLCGFSAAAYAEEAGSNKNDLSVVFIICAAVLTVFLLLWILYIKQRQNIADKRIHRLTRFDELTGLYNMATFCVEVGRMLKRFGRGNFVLVRMDIDRFRVFNNVFGMSAGDMLLKKLGDDIASRVARFSEVDGAGACAHLDADHFVICMRKGLLNIDEMVEHYSEILRRHTKGFEIMPSFGVYYIQPDDDIPVSEMCDRALLALQSAKQNYLCRCGEYNETLIETLKQEQIIVSEMNAALQDNQFRMYLQPQYDHSTGKVVGAEALVRWHHPERGRISPGIFIPIFEKNGFITMLDEYIWESACRQLRNWLDYGGSIVPISVNISRVDVYNSNLCATLCELTEKYDIPRNMLKLEITESAYVDNPRQLIEVVEGLRTQGFVVEMDDFGSGYSSLNTLKEVPVDLIKLDLGFLMGDDKYKRGGSILISIISMARWLGLQVLAEGVETAEQADYLLSVGCKYVQGRYYGGAMSLDEFNRLLEKNKTDDCRRPPASVNAESGDFWSYDNLNNLLFNRFMDAAMVLDQRRDCLEALRINNLFSRETGISDVTLGEYRNDITKLIYHGDRELFLAALEQSTLRSESSCSCRWQKGNGEYVLLNIEIRLLSKQAGRRILLCKARNINEETKLKNALEEKNEMLNAVISHIPATVTLLKARDDGDFEVLFNNADIQNLYSFSGNIMHRELYGVDPRDRDKLLNALDSGKPFSLNYRNKKIDDGIWHYMHCDGEPVTIENEIKPAILIVTSEIADEKRFAEDDECMRSLLRNLLRTTETGIIIAAQDEHGICIDHANKASYRLLNLPTEDDANQSRTIREICMKAEKLLVDNAVAQYRIAVADDVLECNAFSLSWGENRKVFLIMIG